MNRFCEQMSKQIAWTLCIAALAFPLSGCSSKWTADPVTGSLSGWSDIPEEWQESDIEWIHVLDPKDRARTQPWTLSVGPPILDEPESVSKMARIDSLAVVSWNTKMGGGELDSLIADLRGGHLTDGVPVRHFVLLLQEVYREGPEVPSVLGLDARTARPIVGHPASGTRIEIEEIAKRNDLGIFYIPSMRNGDPGDTEGPEDRGNAILSTLSMSDLVAVELPMERQRRIAVGARIGGTTEAGTPWKLDLVSVHLDNRSSFDRFFSSLGKGRHRQAKFLARVLPEREAPLVLGGDLNTWVGERDEAAVRCLREQFTQPDELPDEDTVSIGPLGSRQADYIFFRLPRQWDGSYQRVEQTYGSDHHPLLGWVKFDSKSDFALGE